MKKSDFHTGNDECVSRIASATQAKTKKVKIEVHIGGVSRGSDDNFDSVNPVRMLYSEAGISHEVKGTVIANMYMFASNHTECIHA